MRNLQALPIGSIRSLAISAIIYLALGLGSIFGASFVSDSVWHDAMLVIGGILIGGFCFAFTGLKLALKR